MAASSQMVPEKKRKRIIELFRTSTGAADIQHVSNYLNASPDIVIEVIRDEMKRLQKLTESDDVRICIFYEIEKERWRQDRIHPEFQKEFRLGVLVEEVGEVARALQDNSNLEEELVHVAATATRWLEHIAQEKKQATQTGGGDDRNDKS